MSAVQSLDSRAVKIRFESWTGLRGAFFEHRETGLIGYGFVRHHVITIDTPHQRVHLRAPSRGTSPIDSPHLSMGSARLSRPVGRWHR